jgi:hypothetical protein
MTPSIEGNLNLVLQSNQTKRKDLCSLDQRKVIFWGKQQAKPLFCYTYTD